MAIFEGLPSYYHIHSFAKLGSINGIILTVNMTA